MTINRRGLLAVCAALAIPAVAEAQLGPVPFVTGADVSGANVTSTAGTTARTLAGRAADEFNVRDFGAACSGVTLSDVSTTSGSAIISSEGTGFKQSDVGSLITIGAGANNTTTASTTAGSSSLLSVGSQTGIEVGDYVHGSGIPKGARVMILARPFSTSIKMTADATASVSNGTITFSHVVNSQIASVSAGDATLSTTLQTTISGSAIATFGKNDYNGITSAIAAVSAQTNGGVVKIPIGLCVTNASLHLPTSVSISGSAAGGSIIKWISLTDQTTPIIVNNQSYSASTCTKAIAIAHSANQTVSNLEIDGSAATAASYNLSAKGVSLPCSYNARIFNNYIHDTAATAVATDFGYQSSVTTNLIVNAGRLGQLGAGANGIGQGLVDAGGDSYVISGNTIINPAHYGAYVESQTSGSSPVSIVSITGNTIIAGPNSLASATGAAAGIGNSGSNGAIISGNYVIGYGTYSTVALWQGISVDAGTLSTASGAATSIVGNVIRSVYEGIQFNYYVVPPGTGVAANSTISGNTVLDSQDIGIRIVPNSSGSQLDGIVISGNVVSGSGSAGVAIIGAGDANNIGVTGNVISNNGKTVATAYRQSGIAIGTTNALNLIISGNRIYDDSTATQKYAIGINSGTTVTGAISNNDFTGTPTAPFLRNGTLTARVSDNRGYNPVGAGSTTPGASPWTYTAGITPEILWLYGGAVSSVAKGGTTIATGVPAGIPLQPGESVVVTYSSAPTAIVDGR